MVAIATVTIVAPISAIVAVSVTAIVAAVMAVAVVAMSVTPMAIAVAIVSIVPIAVAVDELDRWRSVMPGCGEGAHWTGRLGGRREAGGAQSDEGRRGEMGEICHDRGPFDVPEQICSC
jgi:hypothetical protein